MSRTPNLPPPQGTRRPVPLHRDWTPQEQAEREQYPPMPCVAGVDGAVHYVHNAFGIEVTRYYIRRLVNDRRLVRHVIGHRVHFAPRDLYDAIVLNTRRNGGAA
jgi:hypothetical protein